jgi:hypothetical protein
MTTALADAVASAMVKPKRKCSASDSIQSHELGNILFQIKLRQRGRAARLAKSPPQLGRRKEHQDPVSDLRNIAAGH